MAYAILRITTGEIYSRWQGNPYWEQTILYNTKQEAQDVLNILAQLDDIEYNDEDKKYNDKGYRIVNKYKRSKAEYELIEV